jgi:hypothetical protein
MKKEETNRYKDIPSTQQLSSVAMLLGEPVYPKQFRDFGRVIRGGPYKYLLGAIKVSRRDEGVIATPKKDIGFRLVWQVKEK